MKVYRDKLFLGLGVLFLLLGAVWAVPNFFHSQQTLSQKLNDFSMQSVLGTKLDEPTDNSQPIPTTTPQTDFDQQKLYALINAYREEQGLNRLRVHASLERSAQAKIADMIEREYFRHADQENVESWYLFKQAGYNYQHAGENLAFAMQSPWETFTAWQESPTHNEQLLTNHYQDMGLAVDCEIYQKHAKSGCVVVLHLGSK